MNKQRNRILRFALAAALALGLVPMSPFAPMAALADTSVVKAGTHDISGMSGVITVNVNGVTLTGTHGNACIVVAAGVTSLTLNNLALTAPPDAIALNCSAVSGAFTLTVTGNCFLTSGKGGSGPFSAGGSGISANSLTLCGTGQLTALAARAKRTGTVI